ncbi:PP2C family protein-serine/threonine phosphatase [Curtobacterium sp. MCPF17_052]|uniref:PP2C family protein-serine/threonine phosphatase n=1 Tax=Curtobacterium sp. MCPF17_052 TaxID=2175655 RepID=UPI000DA752E9|nr:SpoIIE family protein phosphatase [Curtobacterium sp. MCPF17_052]WIB11801.1 SpoIIE family protein phosphatase [Curtobacterium sp. MCPF17_052]
MSRPTSVIDNPLVRQTPISGLLALGALLSLVLPSLEISHPGLFLASLVAIGVATLLAAITLRFPRAVALIPILLAVDFVSLALFRTGTGAGASVFTSLVVLPVVWWASLDGRRTIVYSVLGVTLVILAPYVLLPDNAPRASELVRLGITVVVFGTVAVIVQELSRRARRSVRSAQAREDKVLEEISRAADVQRSLLPTSSDGLGDFVTVAGTCLPAKSVGGDFFDWYRTENGIAVGLGDVMGKGVGAGLIAAAVRATIRSARTVDDASEALRRASDGLAAEGAGTDVTFTTLFHARIDDDGSLQWADAGHGLSFILRAAGGVERLRSVDLPLGMGLRDEWATTTGTLEPGDLLISFSDGVLDLFGGRDDAVDSVAELARADRTPAAIVAALADRAAEVPHDDDVTVIAIRREAAAAGVTEVTAAPLSRSRAV